MIPRIQVKLPLTCCLATLTGPSVQVKERKAENRNVKAGVLCTGYGSKCLNHQQLDRRFWSMSEFPGFDVGLTFGPQPSQSRGTDWFPKGLPRPNRSFQIPRGFGDLDLVNMSTLGDRERATRPISIHASRWTGGFHKRNHSFPDPSAWQSCKNWTQLFHSL